MERIGHSFSFCIGDIVDFDMDMDDIVSIHAQTMIRTVHELEEVVERYYENTWKHRYGKYSLIKDEDSGKVDMVKSDRVAPPIDKYWEVVNQLLFSNKIYQCRLHERHVKDQTKVPYIPGIYDNSCRFQPHSSVLLEGHWESLEEYNLRRDKALMDFLGDFYEATDEYRVEGYREKRWREEGYEYDDIGF